MKMIDTLLDGLKEDAPVRKVLVGTFWTAVVLDTDPPRCGLSSTLRDEAHDGRPAVQEAGRLLTRSARSLAELLRSGSLLEASIGMAAHNALLEVDPRPLVEANAEELLVQRGSGRRVAIVGHFPFVRRVRQAAETCSVLELRPQPGDLPASMAAKVLPLADVVAVTGTSLINRTFDGLMSMCRPKAFVLVLGPSTPLTAALFEAGVDAISGTIVDDPQQVLLAVAQGATFRQVKRGGGVRLLSWIAAGADAAGSARALGKVGP